MDKDELFRKFKLAIDSEYEAYQLYTEIAEKSGDTELGVIFRRLASEEWNHREVIIARYNILKDLP